MARLRKLLAPAALVAVLLLTIGVVALWTGVHRIAPNSGFTDLLGFIRPSPSAFQSKIDRNQRINLLLMARGGAGHDNPDFTDTMLLLSIQPRSRQAILVS